MKKTAFVALALSFAIAASAQRPKDAAGSAAPIVVQGCLQQVNRSGAAGATPVGTSGTQATPGDVAKGPEVAAQFLLTGAVSPDRARPAVTPGAAVGTAAPARTRTADGTVTSSTGAAETPATYVLVGEQAALAPHNGHLVEVTGTLAAAPPPAPRDAASAPVGADPREPARGAAPGQPSASPIDAPDSAAAAPAGNRINVTSVRPLADSCSR
jgi:hypothetical protein